jgi:Kef-type K+ transport system membrane component KefB
MITPHFLVSLLLILVAAWFMGALFSRYGLPFVLGELLAGIILGPPVLGIIGHSPAIEVLAELGIFFVMFHTGMEMDPKELLEHKWPSLAVAVGGFILPFLLGYFTTKAFGGTLYQSLFVGMGISITAIAVQAIILHSMKISTTNVGHIIIGAAIADDILSLIGLSVLLGLAKSGTIQFSVVAVLLFKVVLFFGFTILAGQFIIPKFTKRLHDREGKAFTFAITTALVMAYLAELVGLHLIIGAFLAGQFVRKEIMDHKIYEKIHDRFYGLSYGFLVPIFFASLSFHLHLNWNLSFILFALTLTLMAIIGKLVGSGLGYTIFRRNFWETAIIGFGMNGRGAVEIVLASVVLKLSNDLLSSNVITEPLLTQNQFSALIFMAFVTTLMAPLTLKWAVIRGCKSDEKATFCKLWQDSHNH